MTSLIGASGSVTTMRSRMPEPREARWTGKGSQLMLEFRPHAIIASAR